jgi:hypothetical protein
MALSGSGKNFLMGKNGVPQGGVPLRSGRNFSAGRMDVPLRVERTSWWGERALLGKGNLPQGDMSLKERVKLWLRMCCVPKKKSLGIGCNTAGRGKWGFFR